MVLLVSRISICKNVETLFLHNVKLLFDVIMLFIILHLLVYPSSNGYNSLMDKDEGSIAGVKDPSALPTQMFAISIIFDALALALTFLYFDHWSMLFLLAYILASRAYSYRQIRLKK